MSEKQKNALYAIIGIIVLTILFRPFGNLGWDEVKRSLMLLSLALVVAGVVWHLLKKKKY